MEFDQRTFRNLLGCFATGVTIITTNDPSGRPVGITANSFSSLSLDPPLVLFCLDRKVSSFDAFHTNRHFAVNMLRDDQEELSRQFAKSNTDKFLDVAYETWSTGCPILQGCIASIECDIEEIFEGGDHVIIVGNVRRYRYDDGECRPLLFFRGKYGQIAPS